MRRIVGFAQIAKVGYVKSIWKLVLAKCPKTPSFAQSVTECSFTFQVKHLHSSFQEREFLQLHFVRLTFNETPHLVYEPVVVKNFCSR